MHRHMPTMNSCRGLIRAPSELSLSLHVEKLVALCMHMQVCTLHALIHAACEYNVGGQQHLYYITKNEMVKWAQGLV